MSVSSDRNRFLELARIGVSLRWRLVMNRTNRTRRRASGPPTTRPPRLTLFVAVLFAVGTAVSLASVRSASAVVAQQRVVLHLSSLAFGWIFGPILIGGVDETVDPTRLALLPLKLSELFCVQAVAAVSGIGPVAALIGMVIGLPIGYGHSPAGVAMSVLGAVAAVGVIVGFARSVAALLTIAQRSRAGRDLGILLAAFMGGGLFVVAQLAARLKGDRAVRLIGILRWAPWSWPARSLVATRTNNLAVAAGWLAASVAVGVVALRLWARLSQSLLTSGERAVRGGRRSSGPALNGATTVFGAALSRQWIYLRRSPNSRVAFLFGVAFGVAFPMVQIVQHGADNVEGAAFAVLLAALVNIGASANVLGFDAGSLWLEVLCGGPSRAHMMARSLAVLPNLLVPTWLAAGVVGVWTGQARYVLLVSFVAVPVALIILAEGMVTSIVSPYPLPDGDNPFGNRQASEGRGLKIAITAFSGLFAIMTAAGPVVLGAYLGRNSAAGWIAAGAGLAWAVLLDVLVVRWVTRRLRGSEPELLSILAPLAVN